MKNDRGRHAPRSGRPLRIGILAPPWVPVPPPVYGGTELVVDELARGLARSGCHVRLFTTGDSTCPVERRWLYPRALGTTADLALEEAHVAPAYEWFADVDIVHDHSLAGPVCSARLARNVPVVTTVHGALGAELLPHYEQMAELGVAIVTISHAQRATSPALPVAAMIHHGIDASASPLGRGDGGYVLFLGRMNSDKGADRAIVAARAAGKRILLAAKMWEPAEREYFAQRVEPLLGDDAEYLGEVGGGRKRELLAAAEALVNPIRWNEPFGLVMIEALACGTPVVAFAEGAAPEIVRHGHTGFLCNDVADMVDALRRVCELDRRACRASAEGYFSAARMVREHLALYERLVGNGARRRGLWKLRGHSTRGRGRAHDITSDAGSTQQGR